MMMMTGLLMMGLGNVNTYSLMNMMWMYALMMKMSNMVGWNKLGVLNLGMGLWNGMMKMGSNELMMGMMLMMLGGMSQMARSHEAPNAHNWMNGGNTSVGDSSKSTWGKEPGGEMMLLMMMGMWMTVMSKEWMSMMLSIELQSNGMYLLVCKKSMASGLSYNMMGGMSSSMMMMSLLSMYSESGLSNMEEMKMWKEMKMESVGVGMYGVMLGMLMKMGTAPMHNWMSDVMENMSAEENKWVGGMSKLPLMKMMSEWGGKEMMPMMLTLAMGGMLGSTAYSMKKFMAYSGMHNLGYVLMMGGNNEKWLFFMTQYVMTLMSMLMVYKENVTMWSMSELNKGNKWVGMTMTMSMLSSMGMPPLMGFYGKLSMMEWGLENGWGMMTVMMMMGSVLSASNYMSMMSNTWSVSVVSSQNSKMEVTSLSVLVSLMVSNMVESYTQCI